MSKTDLDDNAIEYDYTVAGFDSFLSRSVEEVTQASLASPGPVTTAMRFDDAQVSGALGDTLRIGKIFLNGSDENIILSDDNNERLLIGRQDNGF